MLRTVLIAALALSACTSIVEVAPTDLDASRDRDVQLTTAKGAEDVELDRIIDGVLITADGRRYPLGDIDFARVRRVDSGRTALLVGGVVITALLAISAAEISDDTEDVLREILDGQ